MHPSDMPQYKYWCKYSIQFSDESFHHFYPCFLSIFLCNFSYKGSSILEHVNISQREREREREREEEEEEEE